MKGDKYGLGLKLPGFFDDKHLDALSSEAKTALPNMQSYQVSNQRDSVGINQWEVVRYLKSINK